MLPPVCSYRRGRSLSSAVAGVEAPSPTVGMEAPVPLGESGLRAIPSLSMRVASERSLPSRCEQPTTVDAEATVLIHAPPMYVLPPPAWKLPAPTADTDARISNCLSNEDLDARSPA
jgi:hypothetical protein